MNNQSLALQQRALMDFEIFLQKFLEQTDNDLQYYTNKIQQLQIDRVPVEVCEQYYTHYAYPKIAKLKGLIQQISDKDLRYVRKVTDTITEALNKAQ